MPRTLETIVQLGLALMAATCNGEIVQPTSPSTLRLAIRTEGDLRRAPVHMDHQRHTDELGRDSCETCHKTKETELVFRFARLEEIEDPDALMSLYHDECTTCHETRRAEGKKAGPVTCGECHVEGPERPETRQPMRWDYSLHARHVKTEREQCKTCHHEYDEKAKRLIYVKGKEGSCRDCHLDVTQGRNCSWRESAHSDCINCHRSRPPGEPRGPQMCAGCHDAETVANYQRLPEPPMMPRGQPKEVWLQTEEAKTLPVHFDHARHEPLSTTCSDCHHQTLAKCDSCHPLTGSEKGGLVTLEAAYHLPTSPYACVGCHESETEQAACAGCHTTQEPLADRTCAVCHREKRETVTPVRLAPLPAFTDAYPEVVKIDCIAKEYGVSEMPHGRIVAKLDAGAREDPLAAAFHGRTEALCAGCHHHSPIGERPPTCRSCHSRADPAQDKPGLLAAYHRQCIGCHQQMQLKVGCEDCHKEARR